MRGDEKLTDQPVDAVSIDLSKDEWDIILEVRLSAADGLD